MKTAQDYYDEPQTAYFAPDADAGGDDAYEAHVAAVDAGEKCPDCHATHGIKRYIRLGIPLFECDGCRAAWFDFVTRESQ